MLNLIWKDLQQNGRVLLAVVGIVVAIYLLPTTLILGDRLCSDHQAEPLLTSLAQSAEIAGRMALVFIAAVLAPAVIGNLLAGERADRSAHFAAYLPIRRRSAVISRLVVALTFIMCLLLINIVVFLMSCYHMAVIRTGVSITPKDNYELVLGVLLGTVLLIGLGCLWSSLLNSSAIATILAIGTAAILLAIFFNVQQLITDKELQRSFTTIVLLGVPPVLGSLSFAVGVAVSLRRQEL